MDPNALRLTREEALACSNNFIPPAALARHCPLDNASYILTPSTPSLGALSRLPIELHYAILLAVDVRSLMAFRTTNKRAMNLVDQMAEWKKIQSIYANVLRLAIGLRTHHTFTLPSLLSALATTQCHVCARPTSSFDVSDLRRVCNSDAPDCKASLADSNFVFTSFAAFESQIEAFEGQREFVVGDERHGRMIADMLFLKDGVGGSEGVRFRVDARIGCVEV